MPNLTNMPNQKLFMATTSKKCQISEIWHKNMPVGNTGSTCSPRLSWLLGINKLVSVTVGRCNKKKQLLLLLLWYWHLKSVHKLKGEGSLQY